MATAKSSSSGELKERGEESEEQEKVDPADSRQIHRYIEECRSLYQSPLISDATRRDYEDNVIVYMRDQATVEGASMNVDWARDTLSQAAQYAEYFEARITTALESGWINEASANRWRRRFHDPELLEYQRKQWMREVFPAHCLRWKKVAEDRKDLLPKVRALDLDASDEPSLATLFSKDAFLRLDYDARKELIDRIEALMMALSLRKKDHYKQMRDTLQDAARGEEAFIHSSHVGAWLREVMASGNPVSAFQERILPRLHRRKDLASGFQALVSDAQDCMPVGFSLPSKSHFLKWTPEVAESFLHEGRSRIEAEAKRALEQDVALDTQKSKVRSLMDAKDWMGAQQGIEALQRDYPLDKELSVMERYLSLHRDDVQQDAANLKAESVLEEMQRMLRHIPASFQGMYRQSLERGSLSFAKVMDHMYITVWRVRQQEPAAKSQIPNPKSHEDRSQAPNPKSQLKDPITVIKADDEAYDALAEDTQTAAVLEVSEDAQSQETALDLMERQDARAESSAYRGILGASMTLKQQQQLVDHVNGPLMGLLRKLEGEGKEFVMSV